ncbi:MAG: hypothetical protein ACE5E1_05630 [Phycisphaerae bacterium]
MTTCLSYLIRSALTTTPPPVRHSDCAGGPYAALITEDSLPDQAQDLRFGALPSSLPAEMPILP